MVPSGSSSRSNKADRGQRVGWLAVVAAAALASGLAGCSDGERRDALRAVVVGVEKESGVLVLDGLGRKLDHKKAEWAPDDVFDDRLETGYYSPSVHPDQGSFVAVRCVGIPRGRRWENASRAARGCQLLEWQVGGAHERVLLNAPSGAAIDSPTWDPLGRRLGVLVGREVLLLDRDGAELLDRWEVIDLVPVRPWGYYWKRSYLRWDSEGRQLYLAGQRRGGRPTLSVARFSLEDGSLEWLAVESPRFRRGEFLGDRLAINAELPLQVLFGSAEHPVVRPLYSADRRFYFSKQRREGWLGRGWIDGFDTTTGQVFDFLTLWRQLYVA